MSLFSTLTRGKYLKRLGSDETIGLSAMNRRLIDKSKGGSALMMDNTDDNSRVWAWRRNSAAPRRNSDSLAVDFTLPFNTKPGKSKVRIPVHFKGEIEKIVMVVPPDAFDGATITFSVSKAWLVKRAQARAQTQATIKLQAAGRGRLVRRTTHAAQPTCDAASCRGTDAFAKSLGQVRQQGHERQLGEGLARARAGNTRKYHAVGTEGDGLTVDRLQMGLKGSRAQQAGGRVATVTQSF